MAGPSPLRSKRQTMITADQYASITGAPVPAGFDTLRDLVVARLEGALGRGLTSAERTEWMELYRDGIAYPWAYPVTACDTGQVRTTCIALGGPAREVEVTYTGGYTDETCPADLAAAVAWGIHTLRNPVEAEVPDGVTSLSVAGEFSVTRTAGAYVGADGRELPGRWATPISDLGGRCATLAAAYRSHR